MRERVGFREAKLGTEELFGGHGRNPGEMIVGDKIIWFRF